MNVIRVHPTQKDITVIDNAMLDDPALSFKAKGVLAVLLRHADQGDLSRDDLSSLGPDGVASIRSALRELQDAGYRVIRLERSPNGQMRKVSDIFERPQRGAEIDPHRRPETDLRSDQAKQDGGALTDVNESVSAGRTEGGFTAVGKPARESFLTPNSTTAEQRNGSTTRTRRGVNASNDAAFDEFWNTYPRKVGKLAAREKFDRRIAAGTKAEDIIDGARRYAAWCVEAARVGVLESVQFIPHPATWLYQGRESDQLFKPTSGGSMSAAERSARSFAARVARGEVQ